jgi:hypothetical protein
VSSLSETLLRLKPMLCGDTLPLRALRQAAQSAQAAERQLAEVEALQAHVREVRVLIEAGRYAQASSRLNAANECVLGFWILVFWFFFVFVFVFVFWGRLTLPTIAPQYTPPITPPLRMMYSIVSRPGAARDLGALEGLREEVAALTGELGDALIAEAVGICYRAGPGAGRSNGVAGGDHSAVGFVEDLLGDAPVDAAAGLGVRLSAVRVIVTSLHALGATRRAKRVVREGLRTEFRRLLDTTMREAAEASGEAAAEEDETAEDGGVGGCVA